jgi:stage V sporulation protein T
MSGTITRRIDDLGRIVIPKELRKTMRLREGDEIEITPDGDRLVLKKFSPFLDIKLQAQGVSKMIADFIPSSEVFLISADKIVAGSKGQKTSLTPTDNLVKLCSSRSAVVLDGCEIKLFQERDNDGFVVIEPVLSNGDLLGTVVAILKNQPDENGLGYIRFASAVLGTMIAL